MKTLLTEQLTAIADSDNLDSNKLFQMLNIKRLISFDVALKQDLATEQCKALKMTTALLTFKVADNAVLDSTHSGYHTRTIECSMDELKRFQEELSRIQDAM